MVQIGGNGLQYITNLGKLKGPEKSVKMMGKYNLQEHKRGVPLYSVPTGPDL
jgi:hypothetical protein